MEQINPALEETEEELKEEEKTVPYSEKEKEYLNNYLQARLETARIIRNQSHDEFDGMGLIQYSQSNLKGGNSFIAPKKNKEDTNFTTGTTRQALLAYVSKINNLNLSAEVKAFNKEKSQDVHIGHAVEDAIFQANELDHDEEKKILRQYEMFMQGTVFVQEKWIEHFQVTKTGFDIKDWDGKISSATWTEKLDKVFAGCSRDILPITNVYLGKITEFDMDKQPYIFSVDYKHYDEAKSIYQKWERWKYVTKKVKYWSKEVPQTLYNNNWRLENTQENIVEEIIYQDKWSNEFVVILNGVMMTPVGMPLPWSYREYNIVKQVYEIISSNFAYGGSLIKRLKVSQQLEDEFWRMSILKTQMSYKPPRGNMSGQVLGSRIFMPGKITPGITAEMVPALVDVKGITDGEVKMLEMMKQNLRDNSLPDLNNSGSEQDQSATEIMQLKRQADILMGMAIFSASMLEKKLSILRMFDILENWFEPEGEVADTAKMMMIKKYRSTSKDTGIDGEGKGRRITKVTDDELPSSEDVYNEEEDMTKAEKQPVRVIYLNPKELNKVPHDFYVTVVPREKDSSEMSKIMFGNMMAQALQNFQQDLNLPYFEEKFSEAWNLNNDKAFVNQSKQSLQLPSPDGQPQPGTPPQPTPQMPKLQNAMAPTPQPATMPTR